MKSRFGVEQSQTPPKPSSMLERFEPLSAKTVRLSNAVAVGVFEDDDAVVAGAVASIHLGYERHSATQSRPRSSKVNAIGCTTSGSPAKSVALKPAGSVILPAASAGGDGMILTDGDSAGKRQCDQCEEAFMCDSRRGERARSR